MNKLVIFFFLLFFTKTALIIHAKCLKKKTIFAWKVQPSFPGKIWKYLKMCTDILIQQVKGLWYLRYTSIINLPVLAANYSTKKEKLAKRYPHSFVKTTSLIYVLTCNKQNLCSSFFSIRSTWLWCHDRVLWLWIFIFTNNGWYII